MVALFQTEVADVIAHTASPGIYVNLVREVNKVASFLVIIKML